MKREISPSPPASKSSSSRGLILDGSSVWKKRDKQQVSAATTSQHWTRYIDSRLKQFGCR